MVLTWERKTFLRTEGGLDWILKFVVELYVVLKVVYILPIQVVPWTRFVLVAPLFNKFLRMCLALKRILDAVFGENFANMHWRVFMGRWVVLKVLDITVVVD